MFKSFRDKFNKIFNSQKPVPDEAVNVVREFRSRKWKSNADVVKLAADLQSVGVVGMDAVCDALEGGGDPGAEGALAFARRIVDLQK